VIVVVIVAVSKSAELLLEQTHVAARMIVVAKSGTASYSSDSSMNMTAAFSTENNHNEYTILQ
jgi:hypothetical protein